MKVANNVKLIKEKKSFNKDGKVTEYDCYSLLVRYVTKEGTKESKLVIKEPTGKLKMMDEEMDLISYSEED